ncbi:MAG TPA: hypothetical protein VFR58_05015 [Flavisolibacter sp.]|nr:hypothetical protein [Flavisolibacter sp.]
MVLMELCNWKSYPAFNSYLRMSEEISMARYGLTSLQRKEEAGLPLHGREIPVMFNRF